MTNFFPHIVVQKWALFIGGAVMLSFVTLVIFLPDVAAIGPQGASVSAEQLNLPVRLTIPVIDVDAAIEHVGLTSEGAMAVPVGPADVAWFAQGTLPGEIGSAVIDGHSGWKDGIPAVFDTLHSLRKGDVVYVENGKGVRSTFIVRAFQTYDPKADTANVFGSTDGKAHLNFITCEGTWNPVTKSSSERLVVFTDKE